MLSWLNCCATGEAKVGVARKVALPPACPLPDFLGGKISNLSIYTEPLDARGAATSNLDDNCNN